MDPTTQFIVPTIIDVPELIVTNEDTDFEDFTGLGGSFWLSKLNLLVSGMSYAVGLGNIWRFPHLCYRHAGGAFLVAYTLAIIVIGAPLFLMELAFGQYANEGPITIWRISPLFEGLGYAMCLISASVAIYYNIINTWIIHYLFASLSFGDLPWSTCDNSWNTNQCFLKPDVSTMLPHNCSMLNQHNNVTTSTLQNDSILFVDCTQSMNEHQFERLINSTDEVVLPANEYFHYNVLNISDSISEIGSFQFRTLLSLIVVWSLIFIAILKDLRLTGRVALIGFFMPYLALTTLLLRAITLIGAGTGISYYFTIDWVRLQNIDIWSDAVAQIFFSLSPCWGGVINLASMNKFHNNFHSESMLIISVNYATSLYSGLVAFSILGYMSSYSGIPIDAVVEKGLGFVFMVYTEAIAKLPLANLNSLVFFIVFLLIGLTSQINVIETVMTTVVDTWPHKLRYRKPLILMILCAIVSVLNLFMCFGNGFYILQLLDSFSGTYTAMVVGILELIAIAWVYGMENFMQDIDDMISVHRNLFPSRAYWYLLWRYLTPSALFAVLLFCFTDLPLTSYRDSIQPPWTNKFGWITTFSCLSVIPVVAFFRFLLAPGGSFSDKISHLCKPSDDWAPSSYVSGPKLINRHMLDEDDFEGSSMDYSNRQMVQPYTDQDRESNESKEDLKVVNGRANYIIPEEEDETDIGLITNESNV